MDDDKDQNKGNILLQTHQGKNVTQLFIRPAGKCRESLTFMTYSQSWEVCLVT